MTNTDDPDSIIRTSITELLEYLAKELPPLLKSGENWQVVLHGGRGGDVIVEKSSKATVVRMVKERTK